MASEADTCRVAILPKLYSAGWSDDQLREQVAYTAGRIVPRGAGGFRKKSKRVDYLLRLNRDTRLAEVETKSEYRLAADGLQQTKAYAHLSTRRQRADRLLKNRAEFFAQFGPEARAILGELLEKYAADGEVQFVLPEVLKLPPIMNRGNVPEIIGTFGGAEKLRNAVDELQNLLYAA